LVAEERLKNGRKCKTSFCIIDAQSVKNTDTAGEKGFDAGKNVSGIKRYIAVDTNGLPHALTVTTANVTDRKGAAEAIEKSKKNLSEVKKILADGGYTGEKFAAEIENLIGAEVEIAKRNELHKFKVIPQRWVVERSFGWLEKCRRLWKNCERMLATSLQLMVLCFVSLILKRF
jgi:transposase